MNKTLLIFASVVTLAAGCSSAVTTQPQNQTAPTPTSTTGSANNINNGATPDYSKPPYCDKLGNGPKGCIQPPLR